MMLGSLIVLMEPLAMKHEQRKQAEHQLPPSDESKLDEMANVWVVFKCHRIQHVALTEARHQSHEVYSHLYTPQQQHM